MKLKDWRILILFTITFVLILFTGKISIYEIRTQSIFFLILNKTNHNVVNLANCSPIIPNVKLTQYEINGVKYPRYVPKYFNESFNFTCMNQNKQTKLILFWNRRYNDVNFGFGLGKSKPFIRNKCPVINCETTNDRNRVNESSLIVFSMYDSIDEFPKWRQLHQRWIFLLDESPHLNYFHKYDGIFNLSATYREDSDFVTTYLSFASHKWSFNKDFDSTRDFTEGKTGFAFKVFSNCEAKSDRLIMILDLKKYISIDIYGNCGEPCPNVNDTWLNSECKEILSKKYKFYLAFENSLCKDYVTEKVFQTIRFDVIPVVYGLGNYDTYLPKSAYINVFDFANTKLLADYLIKVASNKTLYNSYFQWKRFIIFDSSLPNGGQICEMCILLNLELYYGIKHKVIEKINDFWNEKKECFVYDFTKYKLVPYKKKTNYWWN